jgi:hypothetical protein
MEAQQLRLVAVWPERPTAVRRRERVAVSAERPTAAPLPALVRRRSAHASGPVHLSSRLVAQRRGRDRRRSFSSPASEFWRGALRWMLARTRSCSVHLGTAITPALVTHPISLPRPEYHYSVGQGRNRACRLKGEKAPSEEPLVGRVQ